MASPSGSIPDTSLGLTNEETQILRRVQMDANAAGSSSSRAASRASSQGLLLMNSSSLESVSRHFDTLMGRIQARLAYLEQQAEMASQAQYDRAGNAIEMADAEIARLNAINDEMDELDADWERMEKLKGIVKQYRTRMEEIERRAESSSSSRRDDGKHKKHHHSSHKSCRR